KAQNFSSTTRYTDIDGALENNNFVASPIIEPNNFSFKNKQVVKILANAENIKSFYVLNKSLNSKINNPYLTPLIFNQSGSLEAIAIDEKGNKSFVSTAQFTKRSNDFSISLKN